jgi:maltose alpha-D-glucosyltransferase/alpha-amylase
VTAPAATPPWLADAVLYQVYVQSFADSNGDGIGDLAGVIGRLDYLTWLGVTTVWLSPCFVSPFGDAGYDVADYLTIAPRYGSNDDLAKLVDEAGRRGIRIVLDLVPGHTSNQHPWFIRSAADPADHRYIWAADGAGAVPDGFVPSPGTRPGGYLPNFFAFQPALNYGYARPDPSQPWRQPPEAEGPRANRAALRDIMGHWLGLGVAGFRVDMAASLIKDDPGYAKTAALWAQMRAWLDREHPGAVIISEWGDPGVAVPAGFDADFFLQFGGPTDGLPLRSLWNNGQGTDEDRWPPVAPYFDAAGRGTARTFTGAYAAAASAGGAGRIIVPTANHDFARLRCGSRGPEQLPAAFAFLLTWPAIPALYYGEEIGMRYVPGLPDVEGSVLGPRYNRAGSRTPMQWEPGQGAGFSSAPPGRFYLPLDPDPGRPDVATQRADEHSLLSLIRDLIRLRKDNPELGTGPAATLEVLNDGYPLAYLRGGRFLVVVNPSGRSERVAHSRPELATAKAVFGTGVSVSADEVTAAPFGYAIFMILAID